MVSLPKLASNALERVPNSRRATGTQGAPVSALRLPSGMWTFFGRQKFLWGDLWGPNESRPSETGEKIYRWSRKLNCFKPIRRSLACPKGLGRATLPSPRPKTMASNGVEVANVNSQPIGDCDPQRAPSPLISGPIWGRTKLGPLGRASWREPLWPVCLED